jgi:hypothetical protein
VQRSETTSQASKVYKRKNLFERSVIRIGFPAPNEVIKWVPFFQGLALIHQLVTKKYLLGKNTLIGMLLEK